jgi:hypothetical protein
MSIRTGRSATGRETFIADGAFDRSVIHAAILLVSLCASAVRQKESGVPV